MASEAYYDAQTPGTSRGIMEGPNIYGICATLPQWHYLSKSSVQPLDIPMQPLDIQLAVLHRNPPGGQVVVLSKLD